MRVSDIVTELDKRMGTLRRQAQKAERYRKYKTEMKDIELWKASHRWLELPARAGWSRAGSREARAELDDVAHRVDHARTRTSSPSAPSSSVEERRLRRRPGARLRARQPAPPRREQDRVRAPRGRGARRPDRRRAHRDRADRASSASAAPRSSRRARTSSPRSRPRSRASPTRSRRARPPPARPPDAARTRRAGSTRRARELGARRTEIATAERAARGARAPPRRGAAPARARHRRDRAAHRARKELDREGRRVDGALAELRQTRLDLGSQNQGFEARRERARRRRSRAARPRSRRCAPSCTAARSRLTSLQEIQERYEGFARGTRAVMQRAERARRAVRRRRHPRRRRRRRARARACSRSRSRRRSAIGSAACSSPSPRSASRRSATSSRAGGGRSAFVPLDALGAAAHCGAVPESREQPLRLRRGLRQRRAAHVRGRGQLVVALRDAGHAPPAPTGRIERRGSPELVAAHIAIGGEGVLGRMSDLVAFADGYAEVGKRLLGGTVVVDDARRARSRCTTQGVTDRLVTLDGDVVDDDGVVAGGSRDAQGAGVLAQKREIRDLEEIVGRLEHDLSEAMTRLVTAQDRAQAGRSRRSRVCARRSTRATSRSWVTRRTRPASARDLERQRDRLDAARRPSSSSSRSGSRAIAIDEQVDARAPRGRRGADRRRSSAASSICSRDVTAHRERLEELGAGPHRGAHPRRPARREARRGRGRRRCASQRTDAELAARGERLAAEIEDAARRAATLREGCDALAAELAAAPRAPRRRGRARSTTGARRVPGTPHRAHRGRARRRASCAAAPTSSPNEVNQLELRDGQIAMTRKVVEDQIDERYQLEVADDPPRLPPARR